MTCQGGQSGQQKTRLEGMHAAILQAMDISGVYREETEEILLH